MFTIIFITIYNKKDKIINFYKFMNVKILNLIIIYEI